MAQGSRRRPPIRHRNHRSRYRLALGAGGWQLDAIRAQAKSLAATVKRAGYQQADALTKQAGSDPLAAAGAKLAADQLRQESDHKAKGLVDEASRRADSLIAAARRQVAR